MFLSGKVDNKLQQLERANDQYAQTLIECLELAGYRLSNESDQLSETKSIVKVRKNGRDVLLVKREE